MIVKKKTTVELLNESEKASLQAILRIGALERFFFPVMSWTSRSLRKSSMIILPRVMSV